jgi:cobalamin biosynthetic protein CobC
LVNSILVNSAVVINPNNPTNELVKTSKLVQIAQQLSDVLIVDEAFADLNSSQSVSGNLRFDNIIVFRSIGKFFGLAGARIGFLIGNHPIISNLKALFSPWSINSPADYIAQMALRDTQWQQQQSARIAHHSSELETALQTFISKHDLNLECRSNGLFTSLFGQHSTIKQLHQYLASNQLWARIGDPFTLNQKEQQNWLRLSLPGAHFDQLSNTLKRFKATSS